MFISSHKDCTELFDNNDVVYKIFCKDCDASYVGQTKRKLKTRINEHKNNIRLDSNKHFVISKHIVELAHNFDRNNIKILDIERNYQKHHMSEIIHIKGYRNIVLMYKKTNYWTTPTLIS